MSLARITRSSPAVPSVSARRTSARPLYFALLREQGDDPGRIDELTHAASRTFLADQLDKASTIDSEFPIEPGALKAWLVDGHGRAARAYREYLDGRRQGAPRRFFQSRSHALHFLKTVAPTKLVDGAWLYGLLPRWADARLAPLIRIYLEELGDGVPARNHVGLYRQLLARYGCDGWQQMPDDRFTQGAIQLSLAHHAADHLPEIIGFNLGYEQLPLHLPITAYELNELDIDPYYFTLHVTVDNASTGHAQKSLQCALDCQPRMGDAAVFQRRMANGFRLNDVGMNTLEAIASFDIERELLAVMVDKAAVGAQLHSDYCRVAGRTVSDWLSTPGQLPKFLQALETSGWIQRGRDPEESRFWRLMTDEQAPMFGVFDAYEQQLIGDWITREPGGMAAAAPQTPATVNRFRRRPASAARQLPLPARASISQTIAHHLDEARADGASAADEELEALAGRLAKVDVKPDALKALAGFLSPANHATPAGLTATRIYARVLSA